MPRRRPDASAIVNDGPRRSRPVPSPPSSEPLAGEIEHIAYIVLRQELGGCGPWSGPGFGGVATRRRPTCSAGRGALHEAERTIWIVGEAKHNLTRREVDRFAAQVERARRHLVGGIFPVCFCYRARPEVQERVREHGLRLVFSYGKLV